MTSVKTIFVLAIALGAAAVGAADGEFIAGLHPDRRPEGFPKIQQATPIDVSRAMRGITDPASGAYGWLSDQGAWFTPFTGPGMTGPYDLRGWHARDKAANK